MNTLDKKPALSKQGDVSLKKKKKKAAMKFDSSDLEPAMETDQVTKESELSTKAVKRKALKKKSTEPKEKKKKKEKMEIDEPETPSGKDSGVETADDEPVSQKTKGNPTPPSKLLRKSKRALKDINFLVGNLPKSWDRVGIKLTEFFSKRDIEVKHIRPGPENMTCYLTTHVKNRRPMKDTSGALFERNALVIRQSDKAPLCKLHIGDIDRSKVSDREIMNEIGCKDIWVIKLFGYAFLHFDDPETASALAAKKTLTINGCEMKLNMHTRPNLITSADIADLEPKQQKMPESVDGNEKRVRFKRLPRVRPQLPYHFYIGNLPAPFIQLKDRLTEYFQDLGVNIDMLRGQRSDRFCHCTVEGADKDGMESLDGQELEGSRLEIRRADATPGTTVRAMNVDAALVSQTELLRITKCCDAAIHQRPAYGFAYFETEGEAQDLVDQTSIDINGCTMKVSWPRGLKGFFMSQQTSGGGRHGQRRDRMERGGGGDRNYRKSFRD